MVPFVSPRTSVITSYSIHYTKLYEDVLGNTNGTIVYHLVTDIINTSFQNTYIAFSQKISEALKQLKDFNLERIYMNPKIKKKTDIIKTLFGILFEKYLDDIENENRSSRNNFV